jgi:hypothetical protein
MDDIVRQALAKWPNVPDCYGWLGLDARGGWWMRDDRAQAAGPFASGFAQGFAADQDGPSQAQAARGSLLAHDKLIAFIGRNYAADEAGQCFFQNGPQRVYVELLATPYIWRIGADFSVTAHTGEATVPQRCVVDEQGRVYLDCALGFGLVHSLDMAHAAEAIEQGLWVPMDLPAAELPRRFGYVRSPAARRAAASGAGPASGAAP